MAIFNPYNSYDSWREKQRREARNARDQNMRDQAMIQKVTAMWSSLPDPAYPLYGTNVTVSYGQTPPTKMGSSSGNGGVHYNFNEGDLVVLMSGHGQDTSANSNPLWGKDGIYIRGRVHAIVSGGSTMLIYWENGSSNVYDDMFSIGKFDLFDNVQGKLKKTSHSKVKLDTSKLDPIVMDEGVKAEIVAVLKQHHNAAKLFEEWGLGEVIEYGRGMTMMFWGGPGTGKTWMSNCIAKALGTELLVISAAEIQSSEPGGANRAVQAAFADAKKTGKILFLDECDSLITTRQDVGMILASEINTLLTEIEKFEGVCILATNRIDSLDEALERRISLIVEFPNPDFDQRMAIWDKMLPKKLPLGKDVDKKKLAEYSLTGGQIKNVVLQAARMALSEDASEVSLKHFDSSIKRLNKSKARMGTRSTFKQLGDLAKSGGSITKTVDSKTEREKALELIQEEEVDIISDVKESITA